MSRALPRPQVTVLSAVAKAQARPVNRSVHPWAWWIWAIGSGVAVSLTSNPLVLILFFVVIVFVVLQRRTNAPWARSIGFYLIMAGFIIVVRTVFQILIGGLREGTILFTLPEFHLPEWAAGIRIGGPVTLEGLLYSAFDAARLATLIMCVGAANSLANPKQVLRSVPAAFHQIATALVVAIAVAPQLIESVWRVRRARRLRGGVRKGISGLVSIIVPVLEDATDRSLALAAGMESRGFGRTRTGQGLGPGDVAALIGSMLLLTFGIFALLGLPAQTLTWSVPVLVAGLALGVAGVWRSGRYLSVSRYRPAPWRGVDTAVAGCGMVAAIVVIWLAGNEPAMTTSLYPMTWPQLTPSMLIPVLVVAAPGVFTPPPAKEL